MINDKRPTRLNVRHQFGSVPALKKPSVQGQAPAMANFAKRVPASPSVYRPQSVAKNLQLKSPTVSAPIRQRGPGQAGRGAAAVRVSAPMRTGNGSYRITAGAGGQQVGSVMVHERDRSSIELTDLGVNSAHRKQGLGNTLIASALRTGLQMGKTRVVLNSQDNGSGRLTQWYQGMGFVRTGGSRRGYPQLEASISRVLSGVAQRTLQAALPQRPVTPAPASARIVPAVAQRSIANHRSASKPFLSAVVQRAGYPANFAQYTQKTWSQHQKDVAGGADQIFLAMPDLNPSPPPSKPSFMGIVLDFPAIHSRPDQPSMLSAIEGIEAFAYKHARDERNHSGGPIRSSFKRRMAEAAGEIGAIRAMTKLEKGAWRIAYPADPGHGAGLDQVWYKPKPGKSNPVNADVAEWCIVEAKGGASKPSSRQFEKPGMKQMDFSWVTSRAGKLSKSSDPTLAAIGAQLVAAIAAKAPKIRGYVFTTKFSDASGDIDISRKQAPATKGGYYY